MLRRTHSVRPSLDCLEARDVPAANLTVTFSALTHTLTVVGDANDNDVTITGDQLDRTHFILNSSGNINGQPPPYSSPSGVKNLVFKVLDGNDSITFDPTVPIFLQGSVSINGGAGVNTVLATKLTVGKNLSVTNAAQTTGSDSVTLHDFSAGGSVFVRNAGGDSYTEIRRDAPGVSTIKGSLTVTNGTGQDSFNLIDTNVDGNVTINDGHGDAAGIAGFVDIYNLDNLAFRSIIGGNLTVTYLDGNPHGYDGLWDTEVLGNVTLNHGPGEFTTYVDGFATHLPVLIHGNLTITGTGANSVDFGTAPGGDGSGLIVGKKFTLMSGGGAAETLAFNNVQVGGDTSITLGNGGNTISIDDSIFSGRFNLVSGIGDDKFSLEITTGTASATEFKKAAMIDLGSGNNFSKLAYNNAPQDAGQGVVCLATFHVKSTSSAVDYSRFFFPNGGAPLVL